MTELRLALRSLRNRPLFAIVAIVTLALGIGATTTLFTIVNAVLLRPLPYADAGRIVSISEAQDGTDGQVAQVPDYYAWGRAPAFASLAMHGGTSRVVRIAGVPQRVSGQSVSASFFSVFEARPGLGRVFRPDEDADGAPDVVVLSNDLWRRMGADSSVVGRTVDLDERPVAVVGVMPPGFAAPRDAQFWVPIRMDSVADAGTIYYTQVVGRLKPGVPLAAARSEMGTILAHAPPPAWAKGAPPESPRTPVMMTLHDRMFGATRPALMMLLGAVAFLLLIACANVANLLLARSAGRQREFAIRVALGASRWRLARQLLWESVAVSVVGGGIGLLIPLWSVDYFVRLSPASVARVADIGVDGTVLAFTAGISLLTGVAFGLIPAFAATRPNAFRSLKEGGSRTTGTPVQRRIRRGLVVLELSTALVLLTGAGLLTRSFASAVAVDLGFDPARTLTVSAHLTRRAFPNDTMALAFFDRLASQLSALPGVATVGYTDAPVLGGYRMTTRVPMPGTGKALPPMAVMRASGGFMTAVGNELVAGRLLNAGDRAGTQSVAVLSENAARILFPHGSAIGQVVPIGQLIGQLPPTVVGVVKDIHEPGSDGPRLPHIFLPIAQAPDAPYMLAVRYTGDEAPLMSAIRKITSGFDPLQIDVTVGSMQEQVDGIVAPRRLDFVVIDVFAGLALVLAGVGLYGVMAYQVTQRTQELGVRMALGANRARVLGMVLRDGMGLAMAGTAIGLAASFGLSRFLAGMLFGVSPRDPFTFVAVPATLIVVALAACYLPARRATRVDPMVALRYE